LKLLSIELFNFKGIKHQKIITGGEPITIRGANGAGKTTVFDAWLWLLFGKDSTGRSSFEIKTLDKNSQAIHGLDHVVEAVVENDGAEIVLRKEYREKWVKKRGDAQAQLTGHETSCFIDGVPVKISDYTARIGELVNEDLFKLLSDPAQFQRLDWKKRRELMLSLINPDDDGLIEKYPEIEELVKKHGTDDAMLLLKDRRKKLNDSIKQIPVRIDEASRNASESPRTFDVIEVEQTLAELLEKRQSIERRSREEQKKRMDEQATTLNAIQGHKNQLKEFERISGDVLRNRSEAQKVIDLLKSQIESSKTFIADFDKSQDATRTQIKELEERRMALVKSWKAEKADEMDVASVDTACPTCGQDLPHDKGAEMIEKARAKFEAKKKERMDDITSQGAQLKSRIEALNSEIANGEAKLDRARSEIIELNAKVAEQEKILSVQVPDYSVQIEQTTALIDQLNEKLQIKIDFLDVSTKDLDDEISKYQRMIANQDIIKQAAARVAELEAEGKRLADDLVEAEGMIVSLEGYIREKVEKVEAELNGMFESVTFKLFEQQLNGGLSETFVTLIDGVPFADANTASQINAGLEIIEHLSGHYNLRVPCFVDHRESVSRLVPINSQIVNLLVDESYKDLKVEMVG